MAAPQQQSIRPHHIPGRHRPASHRRPAERTPPASHGYDCGTAPRPGPTGLEREAGGAPARRPRPGRQQSDGRKGTVHAAQSYQRRSAKTAADCGHQSPDHCGRPVPDPRPTIYPADLAGVHSPAAVRVPEEHPGSTLLCFGSSQLRLAAGVRGADADRWKGADRRGTNSLAFRCLWRSLP